MKRSFGWKRQPRDDRDFQFAPSRRLLASLPSSLDLAAGMGPQLDQGNLGSCGPNAADECIAFDQGAESLPVVGASRLFVYYCTRDLMNTISDDSGVDNRSMLKALNKWGFPAESLMPYKDDATTFTHRPADSVYNAALVNRIINYAAVAQTPQTMKGTLASRLPFVFGFDVYPGMLSDQAARTGIVPLPAAHETPVGGHDVTFLGFDDAKQMYKFRNHWMNDDGRPWGDNGYGYLPYAYAHNAALAGDFWVINSVPSSIVVPPIPPTPPSPTPSPSSIIEQVDAIFAKLISANMNRPIVVVMLKMVQTLVDSFLIAHPIGLRASMGPADLVPLIDLIFQQIEARRPAWANWLQTVNAMIDNFLTANVATA